MSGGPRGWHPGMDGRLHRLGSAARDVCDHGHRVFRRSRDGGAEPVRLRPGDAVRRHERFNGPRRGRSEHHDPRPRTADDAVLHLQKPWWLERGPPTALVERATGKRVRAVSVSSHKLRPTTISATGMTSGKRVSIVAPAQERAAPAPSVARHEAPPAKGAPPKVASARHPEKERAPARVEKIEKQAPPRQAAAPRHEAKPSGQRGGEKPSVAAAPQPQKESHRVAASGGPPPKTVEKRQPAPPPPVIREEHRTAMNRPSGQQRAPREAPPPQAAQAPPKPPPSVAARPPEHPQPHGQPGEPKKEKSER